MHKLLWLLLLTAACGDDLDELEEAARSIDNWGGRGGSAAGDPGADAGASEDAG